MHRARGDRKLQGVVEPGGLARGGARVTGLRPYWYPATTPRWNGSWLGEVAVAVDAAELAEGVEERRDRRRGDLRPEAWVPRRSERAARVSEVIAFSGGGAMQVVPQPRGREEAEDERAGAHERAEWYATETGKVPLAQHLLGMDLDGRRVSCARRTRTPPTALGGDPEHGLSAEAAQQPARRGPDQRALPKHPAGRAVDLPRAVQSPLIFLLFVAAGIIAVALGQFSDATVIFVVVLLNAGDRRHPGRPGRAIAAGAAQGRVHRARVVRGGRSAWCRPRAGAGGRAGAGRRASGSADARLLRAERSTSPGLARGESVRWRRTPRRSRRTRYRRPEEHALRRHPPHRRPGAGAGDRHRGGTEKPGRSAHLAETRQGPERRSAANRSLRPAVDHRRRGVFAAVLGIGLLRGILRRMVMVGISQVVGMIPEGLPVAMTMALASASSGWARRRAVVRGLCRGNARLGPTVICSDKTGTLTATS